MRHVGALKGPPPGAERSGKNQVTFLFLAMERFMKTIKAWFCAAAAALLLGGCALTPIKLGMSQPEVMAVYGTPTRVVPLAGGTRLQYSRQPFGQSAVMVDLDAGGRVVRVREMLTAAELMKITPGTWTRAEVERDFGPPASIDHVASWPTDIMTYRWRDVTTDMFYYVYLDAANVVQRTAQGIDYRDERWRPF